MKIKDTLNLPRTDFPMRARLPEREPQLLERWESARLYRRMQEARSDADLYLLHDGPPYANGHLHMGHALNKVLKDIVVRYHFLEGYRTPYVPGWDCHGMPIEHHVTRSLGETARDADILEIRRRCRDYAREWVDVQSREFRRLGSLGAWDDPYLTMDPSYEAEVLRTFRDLLADGYVVKGLRAIHWCASCRTALAEAELEYAPHRSPSIYVAFPIVDDGEAVKRLAERLPSGARVDDVELLIWTTTPWTIPANLAIAVHPELEYSLVQVDGDPARVLLLATDLVDAALGDCDLEPGSWRTVATLRGEELTGLRYRHPLFDRDCPVILAEHVTLEQGTGAVHTAPGHGHEDFEIGREYGLEVLCPVDEAGIFDADAGPFEGMSVFDANRPIVDALAEAGALLASNRVEHSYPHCWRCKSPLIYRATEQWFLDVDAHGLRGRLLAAIRDVRWVPGWGEERIAGMVESRPDWCLSRQRSWGVPIPGIYCVGCGDLRMDPEVVDRVVETVAESGSDAWFERPVEEFLPEDTACEECGGTEFSRETDIFDVWFESGVSHRAVLDTGRWPDLSWPSSVYLEGSDQHRGWFQVSLITAIATRDRAPYGAVVTHAHVLDEDGRKMSKSLGNVIRPMEVVEEYGADILRLYLASVDYTRDLPFSRSLIEPVVEIYRKLRNTARFLLANLSDFEPADAVDPDDWEPIDRWAMHRATLLDADLRQDFQDFRFHRAVSRLHNFAGVTLSAVYLSICKDRLYTEATDDPRRRATQTVLWRIAELLVHWLAPVLPFTAEEIWDHLPGDRADSVHLSSFPEIGHLALPADEARELDALMELRESVLVELEKAREEKVIGDGLQATVRLRATGDGDPELARRHRDWLADLLIVSEVRLQGSEAQTSADAVGETRSEATDAEATAVTPDGAWEIFVEPAGGEKCPRCWIWRPLIDGDDGLPAMCGRCTRVVERQVADAG